MSVIVEELRLYMAKERISQRDISKKTDITPPKLSMALNGTRKMTLDEFGRIVCALDVSADRFIKGNSQ